MADSVWRRLSQELLLPRCYLIMAQIRQLAVFEGHVIDQNETRLDIDYYVITVLALVLSTQVAWKLGETKSGWSFFTTKGEAVTPYKKTPVEAIGHIQKLWPKDIVVFLVEP